MMTRLLIGSLRVILLAALVALSSVAQDDPFYTPQRGTVTNAAYQLSDIEAVNLTSGGLTLRIPVVSLPAGPGGMNFGVTLAYNSKQWNTTALTAAGSQPTYVLGAADGGGWQVRYDYQLTEIDADNEGTIDPCTGTSGLGTFALGLQVTAPDGSQHRMIWAEAPPIVTANCPVGVYHSYDLWTTETSRTTTALQTWYSFDGSFLRLEIQPGNQWPNNAWTLYFPDGSKAVHTWVDTGGSAKQSLVTRTDRNGNWVKWNKNKSTSTPYDELSDNYGHWIRVWDFGSYQKVEQGHGTAAASLTWKVNYGTRNPLPVYKCNGDTVGTYTCPYDTQAAIVTSLELPSRVRPGGAIYTPKFEFTHGATYGEISKMTLPSGATVDYHWALDGNAGPVSYYIVQGNALTSKTTTYIPRTGASPVSETTTYDFPLGALGTLSTSKVRAPDGSETSQDFQTVSFRDSTGPGSGEITKITRPDGSSVVKTYQYNAPPGMGKGNNRANRYVIWEYETGPSGALGRARTTAYEVNRNGGTTKITERDWQTSTTPTSPDVGTILRLTDVTYVTSTVADSAVYVKSTAPRIPQLVQQKMVKDGSDRVAENIYVEYDNPDTGNVLKRKVWDQPVGPLGAGTWREWTYANYNLGRPGSVTDPDLVSTTWSYAQCGGFAPSARTESGIGTTTYTWDCDWGRLLTKTVPVPNSTNPGVPLTRTDTFSYDPLGRLLTQNEGSLLARRYAYDDASLWVLERSDVEAVGDEKATEVTYYDPIGRERLRRTLEYTQTSDSAAASETGEPSIRVETRYTANVQSATKVSNPYRSTATSDSTVGWTVNLLDGLGRVCAVEYYSGSSEPGAGTCGTAGTGHGGRTAFSFGSLTGTGSMLATSTTTYTGEGATGAVLTRSITHASDGLGRLKQVLEPASTTSYQYDAAARLTQVTQGSTTRTFTYSTTGALSSAVNPESGMKQYTYSPGGRLLSQQDARLWIKCFGNLNGAICTKDFDAAGRPKQVQFSAAAYTPNVTYNYDADALWKVSNSAAVVEYLHDRLGRVTRRNQTMGGTVYSSTASWRPAGVSSLTLPSGRVVQYSVDSIGRVNQVKGINTASVQTVYLSSPTYAAHGAMKSWTVGASGSESWQWNARLQPTAIQHGTALNLSLYYCANEGAWCAANQGSVVKQKINHLGTSLQYQYTNLDQVGQVEEKTAVGASCWNKVFGYSKTGNMWVQSEATFTSGPFTPRTENWFEASTNRLSTVAGDVAYDAAGNVVRQGAYNYGFDGENRIAWSTLSSTPTGYSYDGEGRRVVKATSSDPGVTYVYDALGQLAAEYGDGPALGTRYVAVDSLGSVRAVTDGVGVAERHDYAPFGEEMPAGLCGRTAAAYYVGGNSPLRFTGKERDAETGLDFFEARYMSSAQGRFTSPDKFPWWNLQHSEKEEEKKQFADYIGNPQNWNMYTYVLNNPLNHTDPTGMLGCQVGDQKYTTCTIKVVYDPKTSKGTLTVTGQNKGDKSPTTLLTTGVVVGGDGHLTPTGTFTASVWEKDHVSKLYGSAADTPWSKTVLGGNAFGPYQLHIKELDARGIFIHGTMGPGWSPTTWGNSIFLSPTSHGCVRMCNSENINLHKIMPDPRGNKITIGTTPEN